MKNQFIVSVVVCTALLLFSGVVSAADNETQLQNITSSSLESMASSASPTDSPTNTTKLIFIHHSTGQNWLANGNGNLGIALRDNNYYVSDTNYGWGPDSIGDNTDLGNWWQWFRGPQSATYLSALYNESDQHSSYSRLSTNPGGENQIIMFKSCFPNSALQGNPNDPVPSIGSNPLRGQSCGSSYHTVANAKGIYIDILEYFKTRQDKLFIVITAPPLSDATYSSNARAFNEWLVNDWLKDYPYKNVFVFDFYNVLTTNGGNANTNDLNQETGNHHRWWNNTIQHKTNGDNDANPNILEYSSGDDHPSVAGNQKATAEFLPLLNYAYNQWKSFVFTGITHDVYSGGNIQGAINASSNLDIVIIHGNNGNSTVFNENIVINKKILIKKANDGNVTIQALNINLPVINIINGGNGSVIQGLILNGSSNCGIYVNGSSGNIVQNNTINGQLSSSKSTWGINLVNSNGTNIINNTVINCEEGINLYNSQNTTISGNTVKDNHWDNIALNLSALNVITGNTITNADSGIRLIGGSNNNTILNNNLTGNVWTSISLVSSQFNNITNNTASNNQEGMYFYSSNNNTLSNNTANGNIWDGIAIHDSNNNTVQNNRNLISNNCGIRVIGTSAGNKVYNNIINSNLWSNISLETTTNNQIYNNTLSNAHVGLYLQGASNNTIYNNTIQNNTWDGIDILSGSNNNTIHNNTISGSYYGERILSSTNNTSYMNNFINNTVQAFDNSNNAWNNGTTGNYWSDWSTIDPRPIDGGSNFDYNPSLTSF